MLIVGYTPCTIVIICEYPNILFMVNIVHYTFEPINVRSFVTGQIFLPVQEGIKSPAIFWYANSSKKQILKRRKQREDTRPFNDVLQFDSVGDPTKKEVITSEKANPHGSQVQVESVSSYHSKEQPGQVSSNIKERLERKRAYDTNSPHDAFVKSLIALSCRFASLRRQ